MQIGAVIVTNAGLSERRDLRKLGSPFFVPVEKSRGRIST